MHDEPRDRRPTPAGRPGDGGRTGPRRVRGLMRGLVAGLALLGAASGSIGAQGECDEESPAKGRHMARPRFVAEVTACIEADSAYALLHIDVPYRELAFRKQGDGLETSFDLIVHIQRGDRQVAGDVWTEEVRVGDRADLRGRQARFVKDLTFPLPPGNYTLDVRLSEPKAGQEGRLCLGVEIPMRLPGQVLLSSILVGACGLSGTIAQLRASPAISFEIDEADRSVCAYAELYHADVPMDFVELHWRLKASNGDIVRQGERVYPAGDRVTALSWELPLGDLWLDVYRLEVAVAAAGKQAHASTSISLRAESDPALSTFFRESFGVLAYIAGDEELQPLRMAAPRDRKHMWDAFWAKRDPTPEDGYNEYKEEFFRRLNFANEEFTVIRPGWKTDRGRIYITLGPPDDVRRDPYYVGGQSIEIWYYDRLGRQYVFVDRTGFGDYELRWTE